MCAVWWEGGWDGREGLIDSEAHGGEGDARDPIQHWSLFQCWFNPCHPRRTKRAFFQLMKWSLVKQQQHTLSLVDEIAVDLIGHSVASSFWQEDFGVSLFSADEDPNSDTDSDVPAETIQSHVSIVSLLHQLTNGRRDLCIVTQAERYRYISDELQRGNTLNEMVIATIREKSKQSKLKWKKALIIGPSIAGNHDQPNSKRLAALPVRFVISYAHHRLQKPMHLRASTRWTDVQCYSHHFKIN